MFFHLLLACFPLLAYGALKRYSTYEEYTESPEYKRECKEVIDSLRGRDPCSVWQKRCTTCALIIGCVLTIIFALILFSPIGDTISNDENAEANANAESQNPTPPTDKKDNRGIQIGSVLTATFLATLATMLIRMILSQEERSIPKMVACGVTLLSVIGLMLYLLLSHHIVAVCLCVFGAFWGVCSGYVLGNTQTRSEIISSQITESKVLFIVSQLCSILLIIVSYFV